MSLVKYIARLQRMNSLIAMRATDPPDEFACKMNLSRSTLFETLQEMKDEGLKSSTQIIENRNIIYFEILLLISFHFGL